MSMTEHMVSLANHNLSPEAIARLQRIEGLAKLNRREYAIQKQQAAPKPPTPAKAPKHHSKPAKAARPHFYNPSQRD